MFTKYATALVALAALASAVPRGTKEPRILSHDDVILPRADGGFDIMKDWEFEDLERRLEREARAAIATENKRRTIAGETIPLGSFTARDEQLQARACEESTELQVLTDGEFTDWDVAMSPVIGATGGQALVMVTKGYQVANSLSITLKEDVSVPEVFTVSLGIETGWTWTSIDQQSFTFYINPGQYGVVVSNPWTRRVTGNLLSGCTDTPTVEPWVSDSRFNQTFGSLSWVSGPIKLCNSSSYPVPYCVGTGEHS